LNLLDFAIDTAVASGKLLAEGIGDRLQVEWKGRVNAVTHMDRQSEALIKSAIHKYFPDHGILAEESDLEQSQAEYRWIIDPLDGTSNYLHGFPAYCVSIGLFRGGHPLLGVIYDPERDELFHAEKGKGAFLNGGKIQVSSVEKLDKSILATGFPYEQSAEYHRNFELFKEFYMQSMGIRRMGAAALDLAYVAAGRLDGYWEYVLQPWDMAAGLLIVEEAGGSVSRCDGGEADIYGGNILASNGCLQAQMLKLLK